MTKPGRISCLVPFCRCTGKDPGRDGHEIICAKHWRPVNATLRRRYRRLFRRIDPLLELPTARYPRDLQNEIVEGCRRLDAMWREIKRQAIEKAMGI